MNARAPLFVLSVVVIACGGADASDAAVTGAPAGHAAVGQADAAGAASSGRGAIDGSAGTAAGAAGGGASTAGQGGVASSPPIMPTCTNCFVEAEAGAFHTCARRDDGRVACWGWNDMGQVGAETEHEEILSAREPLPLLVPGLEGARDLALGYSTSCAALVTGRVVCWGRGADGLLGSTVACPADPTAGCRVLTPIEVPGVADAVEVVAGREHACARTQTGEVWCWGRNDEGETGLPASPSNPIQAPAVVPGVRAERLFAKGGVTCALTQGRITCWGDGVVDCEPTNPTLLEAPALVEDVAFGGGDLCVRTAAGEIYCRGANHAGELGPVHAAHSCGKNDAWTDSFTLVGSGARRIVGVADSVCAVDDIGALSCFGSAFGPPSAKLVQVASLPGTVEIRGGAGHVVAVDAQGRVGALGGNWYGQLGNGESYGNTNVMDPVWNTAP